MALGMPYPNSTLQLPKRPDDTARVSAGWALTDPGGLTTPYGSYNQRGAAGPIPHRSQFIYSSVTSSVSFMLTSPIIPLPWAQVSTQYLSALWGFLGTGVSGQYLDSSVEFYDSTRTFISSAWLTGGSIVAAGWSLGSSGGSLTPPASCAYATLSVTGYAPATATGKYWAAAFLGLGSWSGENVSGVRTNADSYTWPSTPAHPGTFGELVMDDAVVQRTLAGNVRVRDHIRYPSRYRLTFRLEGISRSMRDNLRFAWEANKGMLADEDVTPAVNPPWGPVYPILLIPNFPGMPKAGYFDFEGSGFPLARSGAFFSSSAIYSGTFSFLQRM